MKHTDPVRLLDENDIPGDLRLGLSRMQSHLPSAAELAALSAKLGVSPVPTEPAALTKALPALKIAGGVGLAVVGALAVASLEPEAFPARDETTASPAVTVTASLPPFSSHDHSAGPERAAVRPAAPPSSEAANGALPEEPEVGASRAVGERPQENPEQAVAPHRAEARSPAATSSPSRLRAPGSPAAVSPSAPELPGKTASRQSETELLGDARASLESSPAVALALSEKHRREYPNGAFTQERELIAITALTRLGRSEDARSRAERFRRNYPSSPYRRQIDRLVPSD